MDARILFLKTLILSNLQIQLNIEEMAKSVNVSVPYLQKLFKTETEMSPVQYLRCLRLERAKEILEDGFKRVKEVGFEVGMNDQSHFIKDFKQRYGLTPAEHRKQYWTKIEAEKHYANK